MIPNFACIEQGQLHCMIALCVKLSINVAINVLHYFRSICSTRNLLYAQLSSRRGYTLLGIVIVLSMLAILAALGVGSMREHLPRYRLVQTTKPI